jgi:hypothetical protein
MRICWLHGCPSVLGKLLGIVCDDLRRRRRRRGRERR